MPPFFTLPPRTIMRESVGVSVIYLTMIFSPYTLTKRFLVGYNIKDII